jgi:hypothetical protein
MQTEFRAAAQLTDSLIQSVQRVHLSSLTPESFFQNYQKPGTPVVVEGLLDGEPGWDLNFLSERLGDQEFPVRFYGQQRYQQDKREWTSTGSGVEARTLKFTEYAAMVRSGEAYEKDAYLARCSLKRSPTLNIPALERAEQQLGLNMPATYLNLWVGPAGHTSCLHYDPMDGTLTQMHGSKKVLLFPPSQIYNLYPFPVINHLWHGLKLRSVYSQVYPERPDFSAFPKFKQALQHRYEVTLYPGEVLFLPAGWWHEVTALGEGMVSSVNRFWHVYPFSRAVSSWCKWRAHISSVFAAPHILWNFLSAVNSGKKQQELNKLLQRL